MATPHRRADARTGRQKGFTILELIVVIFIMLAMTGIAVAAFRQFMDTERIKLAGGQLVSAISLARQYAMSRRAKVMVELVSPDSGVLTSPPAQASPTDSCYVYEYYKTNKYANQMQAYNGASYRRYSYAKFNVDFLAANQTVSRCTLMIKASNYWYNKPVNITVRGVTNDSWSSSTLCWNTQPTYPADGGALGSLDVNPDNAWYYLNVTDYFAAQAKGDKVASIFLETAQTDRGLYGMSVKIEYEIDTDTGKTQEDVSHLPRSVRILPYLRKHNPVTGGFTWLLDQDSSALRIMDLPRNIHYVLAPGRTTVDQYDPADLVDQRSSVRKVFFDLWPDGTCTGAPPTLEGWIAQVNTVILRDAVTGDVALLFMPPSSSFTRQRYLFGSEVDSFVAAHSLYTLW